MTRRHDVWIGAAAASLGQSHDGPPDVAAGRYDARRSEEDPCLAVSVVGGVPLPDLVLRAARTAHRRSGPPAGVPDLVIHATSWQPGDQDATAARVRRGLGCPQATALEVRQPYGGGLVALHLAAECLSGRSESPRTALVTTGDSAPHAGRHWARPGRVPGAGATGLVLTTATGVARVLSTAVLGEAPQGALFRSDLSWRVPERRPARWTSRRRGRMTRGGEDSVPGARVARLDERARDVVRQALEECGREMDQVTRFVVPHVDSRLPSGGHIAGLARLLDEGLLRSGDTVVLAGGGCGRSFGCAVLEMR